MKKLNLRIKVLELVGPIIQRCRLILLRLKGYKNISVGVIVERGGNLDRVYPEEIFIGSGSLIASRVTILTHEHIYRDYKDPRLPLKKSVHIGKNSFIGVGAIILPGTTIGDQCIVAAGSILSGKYPSNCLIAGSPGVVKRNNIKMDNNAVCLDFGGKK